MASFGSVTMTAIYVFWGDGFDQTYYQLLCMIMLGYLPYTLFFRYIRQQYKVNLLFLNVCLVTIGISMSLPFSNHLLIIFLPLLSILFQNRKLFYVAGIITLVDAIYHNFLQNHHTDLNAIGSIIELAYIACYLIVLDVVVRSIIKQSKKAYIYDKTVKTLIIAVEAKDDYTRGHSIRVSDYALIIGKYMNENGFNFDLEALRISSLLHDIGKINIPQHILTKNGKLTADEYKIIKMHPQFGADLATELGYPKAIVEDILYHHERFDGKGYPSGIKGAQIPPYSRVIALADTFDAITSNRSYRTAFSVEEARRIILENMGTQFDPELKAIFEGVYPQLHSYHSEREGEVEPVKTTEQQNQEYSI